MIVAFAEGIQGLLKSNWGVDFTINTQYGITVY